MRVIDPHTATDGLAAAITEHLTDTEVASFTIGVATMEVPTPGS